MCSVKEITCISIKINRNIILSERLNMNGIDIHNISSLSVTVTLCPWSAKTVQLPIKANSLSPKILVIKPGEKKHFI